jgi:hypothetical protein
VFSVREGLTLTAEQKIFSFWQHDMMVNFDRPYLVERIDQAAHALPGVELAGQVLRIKELGENHQGDIVYRAIIVSATIRGARDRP